MNVLFYDVVNTCLNMVSNHRGNRKKSVISQTVSVVERPLMVVGSIPHGGLIELFLFQPVLHNWCNKGRGMCYPVCVMMLIKQKISLLIIGKSSHFGGSGFPLSLSR